MADTNIKRGYIKSAKRLKIMAKKFGQRNFSFSEVRDDPDFWQREMGFTDVQHFLVWINNMVSKGEVVRVYRGVYNLSKNPLGRKVTVENTKVRSTAKNPLPEKLVLSKIDYQLLSWLVDRIEHLNGRASRVGDRNQPEGSNEDEWQDFVTNMLDYQILVLLEEKDGERTFAIDIERCKDAFCVVETVRFDPLEQLYYERNELASRRELLVTELAEVDEQLVKLQERRDGLRAGLDEVERKVTKIDKYVQVSGLEDILLDMD